MTLRHRYRGAADYPGPPGLPGAGDATNAYMVINGTLIAINRVVGTGRSIAASTGGMG